MTVSLLVAMARNRVIGRDNALPWRLPLDLRRFKALTMGHVIIMGRKTHESIGTVLKGRRSIVLSRDPSYEAGGVTVARSLPEALTHCSGEDEVFVIGGASVYAEALPQAGRIYLTWIEADIEGDTYFPEVDFDAWTLASETRHPPDEGNPFAISFRVYERP